MKSLISVIQLSIENITQIMDVEKRAFIPTIQITEKNIRICLEMNHIFLGAFIGEKLIGTIALRYANFSPNDYENFPKTLKMYAEVPHDENPNTAFVHSLGIVPEHRNGYAAKYLIEGAIKKAKEDGMSYIVGDSRCPSFNGSSEFQQERVLKNQEIHDAITAHLEGKAPLPDELMLSKDPVLGFYIKNGAKTLWIIPGFFPEDEPCGQFVVIQYKEI